MSSSSSSPPPRSVLPSGVRSVLLRAAGLLVLGVTLTGCSGSNLVERITSPRWGICGTLVIVLDIVALVDVIGDGARSSANKVLWSLLIIFMPILGVLLYFFLGRT
jgi:RsiW-degrading membrane proteinase PrsW (M82 family)